MSLFAKIAWRNVLRNPRRSLITILTIAFGLGAMIFLWGFVDGAHNQVIAKTVSVYSGHLVVSGKGFHKNMDWDLPIPDPEQTKEFLSGDPQIEAFSERVFCPALVGTIDKSRSVVLLGIDPEKEPLVTSLRESVIEGEFLDPKETLEEKGGLLLPRPIAEDLKIKVGKKIVVIGQGVDGGLVGEALRVQGIFETGAELIDNAYVLVSMKRAQQIFALGDYVYQIPVKLKNNKAMPEVVQNLKAQFTGEKGYEVLTWRELLKSFSQWLDYENAVISLIALIFLVVVASGILNTMLMAVMERTREFGIVTALGTKPQHLIFSVSLEGFFLGGLGVLTGVAIGLLLVWFFGQIGIDLSSFASTEAVQALGGKVYPSISFEHFMGSVVVAMIASVSMSAYPAWKATKMDPIEAIRQI